MLFDVVPEPIPQQLYAIRIWRKRGNRMKIVVVGLGKVGRALTQQLSADKHDIVCLLYTSDAADE